MTRREPAIRTAVILAHLVPLTVLPSGVWRTLMGFGFWVPRFGGRRIPPAAVVVPATVGGILLIVIWTFAVVRLFVAPVEEFTGGTGWWVLLVSCYLPALLWGPLLLSITYLYHRRCS